MRTAVRSSLWRFVKRGLLTKTVIFSALIAVVFFFFTTYTEMFITVSHRIRYVNREYFSYMLKGCVSFLPFIPAVIMTMHIGSDLGARTVNNRLTTGTGRRALYLSDLIVSILAGAVCVIISEGTLFLCAKLIPVKSSVTADTCFAEALLRSFVIVTAYISVYAFFQYLSPNKIIALIISLLLLPATHVMADNIGGKLEEPYRYIVTDPDTGEVTESLNEDYVGGAERKVYQYLLDSTAVTSVFPYTKAANAQYEVSAAITVISAAAGLAVVRRKELP